MLALTHNGTRLSITAQDKVSGLLCGLGQHKTSSYKLKDFMGFLYGGQTITFIKHRDKFFKEYADSVMASMNQDESAKSF